MSRLVFLVLVVLSSGFLIPLSAQVPLSPTSSPKDRATEDKYRSDEMDRVHRASVVRREHYETRFPQIKDDFERIQLLNSNTLQRKSLEAGADAEKMADAAGEIKKRATRLRSNLFPTDSSLRGKQIENQKHEQQDLKSLLTDLDKVISSFVHNPMFENTRLVNPEDSASAERDLDRIIDLSAKTKKRLASGQHK